MESLLTTILIILLVYFGAKILFRFLKPYIMRYIAKKAGEKFQQAFQGKSPFSKPRRPEGEISIDKKSSAKKTSKTTVGEYVDYEEID